MTGASEALVQAVLARLRTVAGLAHVSDGMSLRPGEPACSVAIDSERDWSHKSGRGSELRLAVTIRAGGDQNARLRGLAEPVREAVEALTDVGVAWRIVTLVHMGTRVRSGSALVEFRARLLAT